MFKFALGERVGNQSTRSEGKVIARSEHLKGQSQYCVKDDVGRCKWFIETNVRRLGEQPKEKNYTIKGYISGFSTFQGNKLVVKYYLIEEDSTDKVAVERSVSFWPSSAIRKFTYGTEPGSITVITNSDGEMTEL